MNATPTLYSEDEYKVLVEKVIQGTATKEEKRVTQELVGKGLAEIETILEDNQ